MRTLAAALFAVPVIALTYVPLLLRRSVAARVGLAFGVGALLGLAALGVLAPSESRAKPPRTIEPVASARFGTDLLVNQPPRGPITIDFSTPMDTESVAASLTLDPLVPVTLAWDSDRTRLVVTPATNWVPATYYTVSVDQAARDEAGNVLERPVRAAFFVRPATVGRITTSASTGDRVTPGTRFVLVFDRPVDVGSLKAAFRIDPPVDGTFEAGEDGSALEEITFVPSVPLDPGTTYTVRLDGPVTDTDGVALAAVSPLTVTTIEAPGVVRFRPLDGTTDVNRDATVSVRFTQPMERRSTAGAFSVTVGGKPITGQVRWAEGDTVLVFDPASPFPPGANVAVTVSGAARSRDGVVVERPKTGTFTAEKPSPEPEPTRNPSPALKPKPAPSTPANGSTGSGSWQAVETYYLNLMNCTRLGGWVTSLGDCSSPGGRDVPPLVLDPGISSRVARPYAKYLATTGRCDHFYGGDPGARLRRAGFDSYRWAENLGCRPGSPYKSVLGTHLFYQSEKPYKGGHYVNLMNPAYTRVGIGVWVSGGRVRLVVNFYRP